MLFTLTKEETKVILDFVASTNTTDKKTKDLFVMAYKLMGQYKDSPIKKVQYVLNDSIKDILDNNIRARAKKVFKLAQQYRELKAISNFSSLFMYNLENIVKLFTFIKDNESSCKHTLKEVRDIIKEVYSSDLSTIEYNNLIREKIRELKKENNINEVEGNFKFKSYKAMVMNGLDNCTNEELLELLEVIQDRVVTEDTEVREVA